MNRAHFSGLSTALLCLALSAPVRAEEPRAGSVLVFPAFHSDATRITLISVTNSHTWKPIRAVFQYVLSDEAPYGYNQDCSESWRVEVLTPADTVTRHTLCHVGSNTNGYLVVKAQSATTGGAVSHNFLLGSELVFQGGQGFGGLYQLNAAPYQAIAAEGQPTDMDFDGRLDFDDLEYQLLPDSVMIDTFLGLGKSRLALLSMADDRKSTVSLQFQIWNDNEVALSTTYSFRCWFEVDLATISLTFSEAFLAGNTVNDPDEVDFDCDGITDFEAGWAKVSGVTASSGFQSQFNPPILGALTGGRSTMEGGRLLWGTDERQTGQF